MAENSDGQERTEQPTSKRLADAREKGQVPRSKELATLTALLTSALLFLTIGPGMLQGLLDIMRRFFTIERARLEDVDKLTLFFLDAVIDALLALAPFLAAMVVAAVVANVAMSGWNFTGSALALKLDKLDPVKGMKRVFGPNGLMELGKGLAKFVVVGLFAAAVLYWQGDAFLGLGSEALKPALAHAGELLSWAFLVISASLILLVLADVPFQLWNHKRQLKMTKQEVKEEFKQTDGSPELKRRQRQIQFEAAQRRMMDEVPKADVVVTNPTHFAVALRYDQNAMDAPVVVAKGADLIAGKIRSIAQEHNVPILSAPPLARAIYFNTEINQPIPMGLYRAVAQVLAYVYHLRQGTVYDRSGVAFNPDDLEIPDELRRDT